MVLFCFSTRRTPLHPAFVVIATLLLSLPGNVPASWDTPWGGPGRTFHDATGGAAPPVSVRGQYLIEENFPAEVPPTIVTDDSIFLLSATRILALDRVEETAGDEAFEVTDVRWRYEVEQPDEDSIFTGRGFYPADAVIVPMHQMLVLVEETGDIFEIASTELVGLAMATGEEVWRHGIGGMERPAMARTGNSILMRWVDPDVVTGPFWDDLPGRLMRIVPGRTEPEALVEIEEPLFSSSHRSIVTSGGIAYLFGESGLAAYDASSLAHLWTWPPDGSRENSGAYEGVMHMVSSDGNVYFIQRDEYRVTSLDRNGNVRWIRELMPEGESCSDEAWISLHPDMLVVTGVCNTVRFGEGGETEHPGRFYGLNPETGDTVWNIPAPWFQGPIPALISGDHFYRDHVVLGGTTGLQTRVYNIHTGGIVQVWGKPELGMMVGAVAARDGYVFAQSLGVFGGGLGRVFAFETEPANVGVEFAAADLLACGTPVGMPVTVPVSYSNFGPGDSPDTVLEFRSWDPIEWLPPEGYEHSIDDFSNMLTVFVGDMDAGTAGELELEFVPLFQTNVLLRASASSDVRLTDSDRSSDAMTIQVIDETPANLDLSIAWVEVTQGLQDRDHSIGLIAGKPTLIRVYAESNVPVDNVQAVMYLTEDTNPDFSQRFFNRPVEPFENCFTLGPGSWDREDYDTSINFLLPPDLLDPRDQRPLKMEIVLDPNNILGETNRENSVYTRELQFDTIAPICLVTHSVRSLRMGGGETYGPFTIPENHIDRAAAMLPIPGIIQVSSGNTVEKVVSSGGLIPPTAWGPYELDPGGSTNTTRLMTTLSTHKLTSSDPYACRQHGAAVRHVGVVAEDNLSTQTNTNFAGHGWITGVFALRINNSTNWPDYNVPRGGRTMAHEIGHTYRRAHVDCGGPPGALSFFPHPPCQLGPLGQDAFFGTDLMDPMNPIVIPPRPAPTDGGRTLGDLMSYASDAWTSDYTWNGIRGNLEINFKEGDGSASREALLAWIDTWKGADDTLLLVNFSIDTEGTALLEDIIQLASAAVPEERQVEMAAEQQRAEEEDSPWSVELVDAAGAVILGVAVNADLVEDTDPPEYIISTLIPLPDGVEGLRLTHETDGIVESATRPEDSPEVELILPASGDIMDDFLIVDWEASHPGGEILQALIQYSTDNGENWTTLAVNAPNEPYLLEAGLLPGSLGEARIRVTVNDGFNSTEAVSEPFTVTPREPVATIHRPEDGTTFAPGEAILVRGDAYDPEDGPLLGESLVWELSGTGEVGTGSMVLLEDLPAGIYELTLTGTDSDGMTSSDAITFSVAPRQATQTEIAGVLLGVLEKAAGVIYDVTGDDAVDSADVHISGN